MTPRSAGRCHAVTEGTASVRGTLFQKGPPSISNVYSQTKPHASDRFISIIEDTAAEFIEGILEHTEAYSP